MTDPPRGRPAGGDAPDPNRIQTPSELAAALAALKGSRSYRDLTAASGELTPSVARRASGVQDWSPEQLTKGTVSDWLGGRGLPTRAKLLTFLLICEVPAATIPGWLSALERIRQTGPIARVAGPSTAPARSGPRRGKVAALVSLGAAVAIAAVVVVVVVRSDGGQEPSPAPRSAVPILPSTSTSAERGAPSVALVAPAAVDRYGCANLTGGDLPRTVDLAAQQLQQPAGRPTYQVDSRSPEAVAFQLHQRGYMDQAFVATETTISNIATVPGVDSTLGITEATLSYELWDLDGHRLAENSDVHIVDHQNTNAPVIVGLDPPVPVKPGTVYFLRVINPSGWPAVGIYIRSPAHQTLTHPFPVCLVNSDQPGNRDQPGEPLHAFLDPGRRVLSGLVSSGT